MSIPHALIWYGRTISDDDPLIFDFTESNQIAPIDKSIFDGQNLKVVDLGPLKQFANRSPHLSTNKLIVILNVDNLSKETANALLKLIEEPPKYLLLRMSAVRLSTVLPTIRSRCQARFIGSNLTEDDRYPLDEFLSKTLTEQFTIAEELARDEVLTAIITNWLITLEQKLLQGKPVSARITSLQKLLARLNTNINRRLALESWIVENRN